MLLHPIILPKAKSMFGYLPLLNFNFETAIQRNNDTKHPQKKRVVYSPIDVEKGTKYAFKHTLEWSYRRFSARPQNKFLRNLL